MKIGLLKAAIRKAGLTEEEFANLLCYFSQGETIEEALQNVQEAIALHLEVMAEEGLEPPLDEGWLVARVPVAT